MAGKSIINSFDNFVKVCDSSGFKLSFDVIKKREFIETGSKHGMANRMVAALADVISACAIAGFPTKNLNEYITKLADQNRVNSVVSWIESKPWDKKDRLTEFYATITQVDEADDLPGLELKCLKIKRWMLSAVAAAYAEDGIAAQGVLVLQGAQYLGKTEWFKNLVPPALGVVKDGVTLRLDDKDSIAACISNWLVELGELDATFRKSDIAQLKSFITADRDIIRMPYARRESVFPRQTIFFASVNQREFLHDETNRRFWVIPCASIKARHNLDMQQVWAQFKTMMDAGESYIMSRDEMIVVNERNEDFKAIDPIHEMVQKHYDWPAFNERDLLGEQLGQWKTATEIAMEIGIKQPEIRDAMAVSVSVRSLNGQLKRREGGSGKRQLLVPPPHGKDWSQ